jgi:putative Mn2+ efflux pump MntP
LQKGSAKASLLCGSWFGGFQALMPLIGFFLGSLFARYIQAVDHWVAFCLLAILGFNMLKEAFSGCEECENHNDDLSFRTMLTMAIATSIDALAVGISLSMAGNVHIFTAVSLIGVVTFFFSAVGVQIGSAFGSKLQKKAQIAGGVILCLLGLKILLEHLGILG